LADSLKVLKSGTMTTANATLYTVTASGTLLLSFASIANKATADATCFLTIGTINIIPGKTIEAKDAIFPPVKGAIISAGNTISGYANTATAIDYYICGDEFV